MLTSLLLSAVATLPIPAEHPIYPTFSPPRARAPVVQLTSPSPYRTSAACDPDRWRPGFHLPGTDYYVEDFATFEGDLIVGGLFSAAGPIFTSSIAGWDGASWTNLGDGVPYGVWSLTVYNGALIAGGVDRVARWDGARWSTIATVLGGYVLALTVYDSKLIAAGSFAHIGGQELSGIAQWDGASWSPLGEGVGGPGQGVRALAVYGDELIAGGYFWEAGPSGIRYLARWDGTAWHTFDPNPSGPVLALTTFDGRLVVGGGFDYVGWPARRIAAWDGATWQPLGEGVGGIAYPIVEALTVYAGRLVAGGAFRTAGGRPANSIAAWDGAVWSPLGDGVNLPPYIPRLPEVRALNVLNDVLFAGGTFSEAGSETTYFVALWDGKAWHGLGDAGLGVNPSLVLGSVEHDGAVVAAGAFTMAGEAKANYVATLRGDRWEALGRGLNNWGYKAVSYHGELVVGGLFTEAGGAPAQHVARWDGTRWSPFGAGLDGTVYALTVYRDSLVVGGLFQGSDGEPLNCIAKWDGTSWQHLGAGMSFVVRALAVYRGDLIAGGYFEFAGGDPGNYIARWDGRRWNPLGEGMNWGVNALLAQGDDLIAGGAFTVAGGEPARAVARWDGEHWNPLGPGVDYEVLAVAMLGGNLFVGGLDASIDCTYGLSRWDGTAWIGLGSGVADGDVHTLLAHDRSLFVGGDFRRAGQTRSIGVARWDSIPVPVTVSDFDAVSSEGGITVTWVVSASGLDPSDRITLGRAEAEEGPFTYLVTLSPEGARPMTYHDASVVAGRAYWYVLALDSPSGRSAVAGPIRAVAGLAASTRLGPLLDPGGGRPVPIRYTLGGRRGHVLLAVYDVGGRRVRILDDAVREPGEHAVLWDRTTERGSPTARGLYFIRLTTGGTSAAGKLMLLD